MSGIKYLKHSNQMISAQRLTLVPPNPGKSLWIDANQVTCKLVSEDQLGEYSLFEVRVPPQAGLPAHIHHGEEEAYYILEGELLIQEGDRTFTLTTGSFVNFPSGVLYTFKNAGIVPVRLLAIVTPAWYGKFFEEWASQRRKHPLRRLRLLPKMCKEISE